MSSPLSLVSIVHSSTRRYDGLYICHLIGQFHHQSKKRIVVVGFLTPLYTVIPNIAPQGTVEPIFQDLHT